MMTASLRIVASPDRREEVLQVFRYLIGRTESEPGCTGCRFFQDVDNENALTLVEEWQSREQLEHHLRSARYLGFLSVMELSSEPPELRFHRISQTQGMDLLTSVRRSTP